MPKGPPVSDGPANGVVAATTTTSGVSEEHTQLQLSAAVSDFLSGGDTNAGLRALRDLPPEHRRRFIKVVLAATLCKGLRNALLMRDVQYLSCRDEQALLFAMPRFSVFCSRGGA